MRKPIRSHEDLIVWQRAVELTLETYRISHLLPPEERYVLSTQLRRAAISVVANIAEGCARGTRREMRHFLVIARGSLRELEAFFVVAVGLTYVTSNQLVRARSLAVEVGKMSNALRTKLA